MLSNLKKLNNREGGFTIIEVMIVLAIAGLIMVIVFLAVPQLQRNQRNTRRKDAANRIKTELENYSGNNNGEYPTASLASNAKNLGTQTTAQGFFIRYLGCTPGANPAKCTGNIDDPRTGEPLGTGNVNGTNLTTVIATTGTPVGNEPGSIGYGTSLVCDGENLVSAGARNFAVTLRLEGGSVYCVDNH